MSAFNVACHQSDARGLSPYPSPCWFSPFSAIPLAPPYVHVTSPPLIRFQSFFFLYHTIDCVASVPVIRVVVSTFVSRSRSKGNVSRREVGTSAVRKKKKREKSIPNFHSTHGNSREQEPSVARLVRGNQLKKGRRSKVLANLLKRDSKSRSIKRSSRGKDEQEKGLKLRAAHFRSPSVQKVVNAFGKT